MDRSELAKRYLEGQISRRVFIRRLVTSGVSAMAAIAYADVLLTTPAAAATDFYIFVFDYGFTPDPAPLGTQRREVEWGFSTQDSHSHSATDKSGMGLFDSGFRAPGSAYFRTFIAAGKYPYHCKETNHTPMDATIRVPILVNPESGPLGTTFTITWASQTAPAGFVFDAQIKGPKATAFRDWKIGETVRRRSFTPTQRGQFQFQARLRKLSNGAHAGYCMPKTINVT
jgi:plastocyanin